MDASRHQDRLTDRQRRFVEEYLVDLNASAAAIRAGYAAKSAGSVGPRLKNLPRVRAALDEAMAARSQRMAVTQDRVVEELARIAFADIRDFAEWDEDGIRLRPSQSLAASQTACVAELVESGSKTGKGVRLKLHGKTQALAALARHLGSREPATGSDARRLTVITCVPEPALPPTGTTQETGSAASPDPTPASWPSPAPSG